MTAAPTLSAKEVARELGTDARTLRKFLREVTPKDDQPGQGGRWTFTKGEVTKIKKKFDKWGDGGKIKAEKPETLVAEAKPAKGKKGKKAQIEEPTDVTDDEDIDFTDLDDPDEEEIEEEEEDEEDDDTSDED